jgi:hypothetical protein
VQAGSRFLSDAESRYAMIELECLAAAWAMRKCHQFLEGLPSFQLVTDHRPLIPILNDYHLDKLDNPRILRLRLSMQRYSFVAVWVPGKDNVMADALSRSQLIILPLPTRSWMARSRFQLASVYWILWRNPTTPIPTFCCPPLQQLSRPMQLCCPSAKQSLMDSRTRSLISHLSFVHSGRCGASCPSTTRRVSSL